MEFAFVAGDIKIHYVDLTDPIFFVRGNNCGRIIRK